MDGWMDLLGVFVKVFFYLTMYAREYVVACKVCMLACHVHLTQLNSTYLRLLTFPKPLTPKPVPSPPQNNRKTRNSKPKILENLSYSSVII